MTQQLIPPRFLFRFSVPCHRHKSSRSKRAASLNESHRLPCFEEIDGRSRFAEVRAGWSEKGLTFLLTVEGKKSPPQVDPSHPERSDGLSLWIDTRDTHTIHRASRFCHQFLLVPAGGGPKRDRATGALLPIHRARENPKPVRPETLKVHSRRQSGGYTLEVFIPAEALTGFEPADHPRLGFTYLVNDSELGQQTFSCPSEFPFAIDPSVWGTLELVE